MSALYIPDFSEMLTVAQSRGADSEAPGLWDGLVGDWPLAEGGGLTAHDLAGRGSEGTLTNMPVSTAWVAGGERGWVIDGKGADDHDDVIKANGLVGASQFSASAWVNLTSGDEEIAGSIVNQLDASAAGWSLQARGSRSQWEFTVRDGSAEFAFSATGWADSAWHHLVGTYDGATIRLFVDGQEGTSASNGFVEATGNGVWLLQNEGNDTNPQTRYRGLLSGVLVHNRALALNEAHELFANPYSMHTLRRRVRAKAPVAPAGHAGPLVNAFPLKSKLKGLAA